MLRFHNTLSREKEAFIPLVDGEVGLYVCGITVYDHCHIGHGRVMVVYDVLYRHLLARGYTVRFVRNITDVDDKIIRRAAEQGVTPKALAERFIDAMHANDRALSVLPPTHEPRATESINAMVRLIETLIDSGHAYVGDNSDVFYAVSRFPGYGKLSGRKLEELRAGERVAIDEHKRDPLDFVLWKSSPDTAPNWPSPWGPGRPGWHIECSAMASELLGETFDIHGGGTDLEFPHHENEIAQSEAANGKPLARYWLHNGLVRVDNEKMSKSLNNFLTIDEVVAQYGGETLRLLMLGSHYRSPMEFSEARLEAAHATLRRLYTALRDATRSERQVSAEFDEASAEVSLLTEPVSRFDVAMDDDLNTPEALAVLHELAGDLNRAGHDGDVRERQARIATLRSLGERLGLLQADPEQVLKGIRAGEELDTEMIDSLIAERVEARARRDFARGDEIRDHLLGMGVVLEDRDGKTIWRKQ